MRYASWLALSLVVFASGCEAPPQNGDTDTDGGTDTDVVRERLDAPFVVELHGPTGEPGPLALLDADVAGVGSGVLLLEGTAVTVRDGAVEARAFEPTHDGRLRPVARRVPAPRDLPEAAARALGGAATLAVALDDVSLGGFSRAVLIAERKTHELEAPVRVSASALMWIEPQAALRLQFEDPGAGSAGAGAWGSLAAAARGHASLPSGAPPAVAVGGLLGRIRAAHADPGDPCTATSQCTGTLYCTTDPVAPPPPTGTPPAYLCSSACVQDELTSGTPLCIDDESCCNAGSVCDDAGACVPTGTSSGGGSGGSTSSTSSGGCGDNDHDGVCNAIDNKPNESCSADSDGDGCNDSCDSNPNDASGGCLGCRTPRIGRPSSLFWSLVLLAVFRGRRRRRAPPCNEA